MKNVIVSSIGGLKHAIIIHPVANKDGACSKKCPLGVRNYIGNLTICAVRLRRWGVYPLRPGPRCPASKGKP